MKRSHESQFRALFGTGGMPSAPLAPMLISLFMFHGCHRLLNSLHDMGLPRGRWGPWLLYGAAVLVSIGG